MKKIGLIIKYLTYLAFSSEILPFFFCLVFLRKITKKELKVFFIYTLCLAVLSIIGLFSLYIIKDSGYYFLSIKIYTIIEFSLIAITLHYLIKQKNIRKLLIYLIPLFLAFSVYNIRTTSTGFNNYPLLVEFFTFIIILIYYFFEKLNTVGFTPIYNKISFWIAVGLFFYFTGNFFYILLVENSRNESIQVKNQLIIMYSVVTIIKNLILGLAFLVGKDEDDNANNFIPFPSDLDLDATTPNQ